MQQSRHIALVTPAWEGHHPAFCTLIARALIDLGHRVTVHCPNPAELRDSLRNSAAGLSAIEFAPRVGQRTSRLRAVWDAVSLWRDAARAVHGPAASRPDLTFFAWLDDQLVPGLHPAIVDRAFPHAWSGLYYHAPAVRRWVPGAYAALRARHCVGVAMLDEISAARVQENIARPVTVFPEVTDESVALEGGLEEAIRARAAGRRVVGLVGSLESRKGVFTLMRVAQEAADEPWFFVFAGQVAQERDHCATEWAEFRAMAQRAPPNCFFHLARIPGEAQFNSVVRACDVLFAAYWDFPSSSNLLSKAAVFGKPILVSEGHCMARRVAEYGLGVAIPQRDAAACIDALRQVFDGVPPRARYGHYRERHSMDRLAHALDRVVASSHSAG